MLRVAQAIIDRGEYLEEIRNYERYGSLFSEPISYRIDPDGSRIPLFYGEVKIDANDKYHPIPRTRPSEGLLGLFGGVDWPDAVTALCVAVDGWLGGNLFDFDLAEGYGLIEGCDDYEEAWLWLLEDEYKPIEGRLASDEIH